MTLLASLKRLFIRSEGVEQPVFWWSPTITLVLFLSFTSGSIYYNEPLSFIFMWSPAFLLIFFVLEFIEGLIVLDFD